MNSEYIVFWYPRPWNFDPLEITPLGLIALYFIHKLLDTLERLISN